MPEIKLHHYDAAYKLKREIDANKSYVLSCKGDFVFTQLDPYENDSMNHWRRLFIENKLDEYTWTEYKATR